MLSRTARPRTLASAGAAVLAGVVAVTGSAAVSTATVPAASAAPSAGTKALSVSKKASTKSYRFTNKKRAGHGVRRLKRSKHLNKLAKRQAVRMASQHRMFHNPRLSREMKNWCALGENVAYNRSVKRANRALWRSPGHRANMLKHQYDQMGAGVAVDRSGTRWVVQVFRKKC